MMRVIVLLLCASALVCQGKETQDKTDRYLIACHTTDFTCFQRQYCALRDHVLLGNSRLAIQPFKPLAVQYGESCVRLTGWGESELIGFGVDSINKEVAMVLELPVYIRQVRNETNCAKPKGDFTGIAKYNAANTTLMEFTANESYRSGYSRYDSDTPLNGANDYAPWSDEFEDLATERPKSAVVVLETTTEKEPNSTVKNNQNKSSESTPTAENLSQAAAPGTSSTEIDKTASLPDDILAALGDPKGKDEILGPKIPEEIAERWGRILVDGLIKEQKQEMLEKTLIPENFVLLKAPQLNPEIAPVLSEPVKNRDKILEKTQQHLGIGIAGLSNLTSLVIKSDVNKIEILKKLSEISQIFLDLHHENTINRRKLVATCLDKKFHNIVKDSKRDAYLFGTNLGDKIKTSKTAERSGLQVKRSDGNPSTSRKFIQRENWRGPPKKQGQRPRRQGGPRNRYWGQPSRRPPPPADRPSSSKPNAKNPKT